MKGDFCAAILLLRVPRTLRCTRLRSLAAPARSDAQRYDPMHQMHAAGGESPSSLCLRRCGWSSGRGCTTDFLTRCDAAMRLQMPLTTTTSLLRPCDGRVEVALACAHVASASPPCSAATLLLVSAAMLMRCCLGHAAMLAGGGPVAAAAGIARAQPAHATVLPPALVDALPALPSFPSERPPTP